MISMIPMDGVTVMMAESGWCHRYDRIQIDRNVYSHEANAAHMVKLGVDITA